MHPRHERQAGRAHHLLYRPRGRRAERLRGKQSDQQVTWWKATGQHLSPEAKADLAAQAEQRRYARKQLQVESLFQENIQRVFIATIGRGDELDGLFVRIE